MPRQTRQLQLHARGQTLRRTQSSPPPPTPHPPIPAACHVAALVAVGPRWQWVFMRTTSHPAVVMCNRVWSKWRQRCRLTKGRRSGHIQNGEMGRMGGAVRRTSQQPKSVRRAHGLQGRPRSAKITQARALRVMPLRQNVDHPSSIGGSGICLSFSGHQGGGGGKEVTCTENRARTYQNNHLAHRLREGLSCPRVRSTETCCWQATAPAERTAPSSLGNNTLSSLPPQARCSRWATVRWSSSVFEHQVLTCNPHKSTHSAYRRPRRQRDGRQKGIESGTSSPPILFKDPSDCMVAPCTDPLGSTNFQFPREYAAERACSPPANRPSSLRASSSDIARPCT